MIYLASFRGTRSGLSGFTDWLICKLDKSIYSHTEVCIGNPLDAEVECYSSSGVDGGVRRKVMKLDPTRWHVQPVPWATAEQVREMFADTEGQPYDYLGVARFLLPWMLRAHPRKWFCSEWALAAIGVKDAWRFSPGAGHSVVETFKG